MSPIKFRIKQLRFSIPPAATQIIYETTYPVSTMMHSSDAYESHPQVGYVLVPVNANTRSFLSQFTDVPYWKLSLLKIWSHSQWLKTILSHFTHRWCLMQKFCTDIVALSSNQFRPQIRRKSGRFSQSTSSCFWPC